VLQLCALVLPQSAEVRDHSDIWALVFAAGVLAGEGRAAGEVPE